MLIRQGCAAYDLRVQGHDVTLIDSEQELGGMLRWAIPEFRLPFEILQWEIEELAAMGVKFQAGTMLGRDVELDELATQYDAVICAIGCGSFLLQGISIHYLPPPVIVQHIDFL